MSELQREKPMASDEATDTTSQTDITTFNVAETNYEIE